MEDSTQEENIEILEATDSQLLIEFTINQAVDEKERQALKTNREIVAIEEKTMPYRLIIKIQVSKRRLAGWFRNKIRKALLPRTGVMADTEIEFTGLKKENSHLISGVAVTSIYGGQIDQSLKELTVRPIPGIHLEETSKLLFREPRRSAYEGKIEFFRAELINECYKIMGLMRLA